MKNLHFLSSERFFHLSELVDLLTDAVAQYDQHGHGHLHVALLGVVTQHLLHDGAEELGRQVRREQQL